MKRVSACSDGFHVLEHQVVHIHSQGATTEAFKIESRDYAPVSSAAAIYRLKTNESVLLINRQSNRAAIGEPCDSTDSGEKRTRLRRPNRTTEKITHKKLAKSHWVIAPVDEWKAVWEAERATVPDYITSTFYLVTGLLLPVWKHFAKAHSTIYRLTTVDGQSLLGRYVSVAAMATAATSFLWYCCIYAETNFSLCRRQFSLLIQKRFRIDT
ncbi:MAG: hypothetical protein VKJ64_21935 [Leptolyngbyaceae bacterium]|nr:hypothetical protein [Leptolyngbyaceae bacterium]